MKLSHAFAPILILGSLFVFLSISHSRTSKATTDGAKPGQRAVVVELFTSEGCSSCPPADALLKALSEQQTVPGTEIIALEEHVDYWDHLGWKDPFSKSEFTERQNEYGRTFRNDGVYTPQMIVDGQTEFVGSRAREAQEVIQKAALQPKVEMQLNPTNGPTDKAGFEIKISGASTVLHGEPGEVWVAITEKDLHSDVKAGENSGERLQHGPVVRLIKSVSSFHGPDDYMTHAAINLQSSWQRENLAFIAFVVTKNSHKIVGAISAKVM